MKKTHLILLLFIAIFFSDCKNKIENPNFDPRLDLRDANIVFTIDASLYKITNDNTIEKVSYYNTDGTEIYENPIENSEIEVYKYLKGNNFLLLKHSSRIWNENRHTVMNQGLCVVDISNGKTVNISNDLDINPRTEGTPYSNDYNVQNSSNNFYFYDFSKVYKLDLSFSLEQYSASGTEVVTFKVNSDNYMMYMTDTECYLKNSSGSIISISDNLTGNIRGYWLGTDNNFYMYRHDYDANVKYIDRVTIDGINVSIENIISGVDESFDLRNQYYFKQEFVGANLFVNRLSTGKSWIYFENTQTIEDKTSFFPDYGEVIDVDESTGYFYIATDDNIYKFDLSFQYTELFDASDFDIYAMCVDMNNDLIFNALRYSDGKVIIGSVDSEGNVIVIDDTLNKKVEYLEYL